MCPTPTHGDSGKPASTSSFGSKQQEFSWTEDGVDAAKAQRGSSLALESTSLIAREPMFCFEVPSQLLCRPVQTVVQLLVLTFCDECRVLLPSMSCSYVRPSCILSLVKLQAPPSTNPPRECGFITTSKDSYDLEEWPTVEAAATLQACLTASAVI